MAKQTPTDRRLAAITELTARFAPLIDALPHSPAMKADLLTSIAALRPLGRSVRWAEAIDLWVRLVGEKVDEAPAWALHQPAVWAANAA